MKKPFDNLLIKLRRFMTGRYGIDRLWSVLLIFYVITIIIANIVYKFSKISYYAISVMGLAILGFAIFRALSKNIEMRRSENQTWLRFEWKIKNSFKLTKDKFSQRKTHKFVKCPKCKKQLRLPKHKGKINVSCPACNNQFIINTGKKM